MTFEPLSTSQRSGAIVVATFALLSALALAFIALRTIRLAIILFSERDNNTSRPPEILFFRTQLGHYAGCLILSNMFISAAGLIDFSWVSHSGLSQGSTCSAQVVLMQIGIWGTCWFTAALGVHTLSSLGFHIRPARWRSSVFVALGWTIACIAALAPLRKSNVYGPTGTSCGITPSYPKEIFVLEALPIILGAFVSTAGYSVIFILLRGKLCVNSAQKLRDPNSTSQQGEDRSEEYYKFICMIIRTMFWFPLAFVLLLIPFCITHILTYAGHSVPSAPSVFADVCVFMLGFVNVALLCNTFRVISPVCRGPRATRIMAETVKTFGHDASGESPIVPQPTFSFQPTIPSYEYPRTKVAPPLVFHGVIPPEELSRYPRVISPQSSTKRQHTNVQSEIIADSPLRTASIGPRSLHVPLVTGDTRHEPSTQDEKCSFHPMADTDAFENRAKEPAFKSKAPPALNLSRFSAPLLEVNTWSSDKACESHFRPSSFCPSAQTMMLNDDGDSVYSEEIVQVSKVRPLPQIPEPSDDEENTVDPCPITPRRLQAMSCMTMSTVWSQESGYTIGHSVDTERESQEAYRRLVADVVVPGVILDNQADMGEAMTRQSTPPDPHGHHPEILLHPIKPSAHFTNMLIPMSRNSRPSTIVIAPHDSFV